MIVLLAPSHLLASTSEVLVEVAVSVSAIVLRPWTGRDAETLLEITRSADDLTHQLPQPLETIGDARRVIDTALVCDERAWHLAIVVERAPVGNVAVSHIEWTHDTAWVSYFSSGAVRGRGLVSRSVNAVAHWALAPAPAGLGLFRLELGQRVSNPASAAVARAAGFLPEGLERSKLRYGDHRHDVQTWARLATDPHPPVDGVHIEGS